MDVPRIGTSCEQHNCSDNHCTAGLLCPCECHNKLMDDGSVSYRRYPPEDTATRRADAAGREG